MYQIPTTHQVRQLFEKLDRLHPYPIGVVPVPEQIQGTSFFPGGTGLWCEKSDSFPQFPIGGVMILGHDFHSVAGYELSRENKGENLRSPTWRHLLAFLSRVPINVECCFFTNIYMGLREGKTTIGRFPGSTSPEFVQRCRDFFLIQLAAQRPSLILTLGGYVPPFLAPLSLQLAPWASFSGFQKVDNDNIAIITEVDFGLPSMSPCVVASIVHPSFRPSNIRHRRWGSLSGDAAEIALVQKAAEHAKISQQFFGIST